MKNRVSASALIICLFLLSTVLYYNTIGLFPVFMHAWTQSEHYALALCFLENGFDFFHPCTFNLQTIDGITPTDFPINEYIVALIMKATGSTSSAIYRTYTLFISITGLLFLYSLAKKITGSEIKSRLVTLFAFLSPVYIYYQSGFLPSVPAIAFTFIAYFYYFSFKNDNKRKQLYLAVLFFLLAALIRRPFFIFLFATLLQEMWGMFKSRKAEWSAITPFTLSIIVFFSYYRYNVYLSKIYGNAFLDSFLPARSWNEFQGIVNEIYRTWKFQYFTGAHYIMLIIALAYFIYNVLKHRTIAEDHKKYWLQLFLIFSGTLCYFVLMMRQYHDHDYYFLDSLFVPIVLLFATSTNEINFATGMQKTPQVLFFSLLIILAFVSGKQVQEGRYTVNEWDRVEQSRVNYTGFDKYLDSAGIPKDSKILVIESYSTNIPLILMKRKGYTVYQTNRDNPVFPLFRFDWDYVAIQDIFLVSDVIYYYPILKSLLERVGGNGKISLYKKSPSFKPKSLKTFLGVDSTNSLYSNFIDFDSEIADEHFKYFENKTNEVSYSKQNAALLKPEIEYQSAFSIKGNELKKNQNLKILITAHIRSSAPIEQLQLIASVATQTETKFYQSFDLNRQIKHKNKWEKMETQFVLPSLAAEDELKIYFWNRAAEKVYCDDLDIVIYN
ncbi:MAG: glycosyltransferase family 39 protein [Bacteroidia bacterium]